MPIAFEIQQSLPCVFTNLPNLRYNTCCNFELNDTCVWCYSFYYITCITKINFSPKSFFIDFKVEFCRSSEALETVFVVFASLETGLQIDGSSVV